jgi:hypothetical protein
MNLVVISNLVIATVCIVVIFWPFCMFSACKRLSSIYHLFFSLFAKLHVSPYSLLICFLRRYGAFVGHELWRLVIHLEQAKLWLAMTAITTMWRLTTYEILARLLSIFKDICHFYFIRKFVIHITSKKDPLHFKWNGYYRKDGNIARDCRHMKQEWASFGFWVELYVVDGKD